MPRLIWYGMALDGMYDVCVYTLVGSSEFHFVWRTPSSMKFQLGMVTCDPELVIDLVFREHHYIPTCGLGHSYLDM